MLDALPDLNENNKKVYQYCDQMIETTTDKFNY